ncbi:MAG: leucyl/phenylalanyl-tRNA--protein transferase [Actinomycetota bacterium]|nr:MAG: leucyl/phenylalanyl-tRNA--protein transferase [Actinomycetota bacterium]
MDILVNSNFNSDMIFRGGDLSPATLLDAYRSGLFPMPLEGSKLGWFCPQWRGIFLTAAGNIDGNPCKISRSLRKSLSRFTYSMNLAFREVISNCANPQRPDAWITPDIQDAYIRLHEMGWAHSFEAWTGQGSEKELAGGLYGVAIGGLFAGESMFHKETDASKAALVVLASKMIEQGGLLIDTQWMTRHLESLGGIAIPRMEYLQLLDEAITLPLPGIFQQRYSGQIQFKI